MGYPQKIVTCCYCGTRAALVLKGRTHHELSCSRCGAPLHDLKMLRLDRKGPRDMVEHPRTRAIRPVRKTKHRRKRRSLLKNFVEEAFDLLEDVFD